MTKEQIEEKIKEILSKDDKFKEVPFKVIYQSNKKYQMK